MVMGQLPDFYYTYSPSVRLTKAIMCGDTESAMTMIIRGYTLPTEVDGRPLLHYAIWNGLFQLFDLFMRYGADMDAVDRDGKPLLHYAVETGNINKMIKLLPYVDVNSLDYRGCTPLFYALISENVKAFNLLFLNGADVNVQNDVGDTPLHMAAYNPPCHWIVLQLLQQGADVHIRNGDGDTALDVALFWAEGNVVSPQAPIIKELLVWGSVVDERSAIAVHYLVYDVDCDINILSRVLQEVYCVDFQDYFGRTPLHYAVRNDRADLVHLLLEAGAKIDSVDFDGRTPLNFGVYHGCTVEMFMLLIEMGADVKSTHLEISPAFARKVKAYLLDYKNDITSFMLAFISKSNCNTHYYCFIDTLKYMPASDCLNFFLAFINPLLN